MADQGDISTESTKRSEDLQVHSPSFDTKQLETSFAVNDKSERTSLATESTMLSPFGVSEEEYIREINHATSCFVAVILANSIAQLIEEEYNNGNLKSVTAAQVKAARLTADAARAAQTGDIEGAARAVLDSIQSSQMDINELSSEKLETIGNKSKTCCVL